MRRSMQHELRLNVWAWRHDIGLAVPWSLLTISRDETVAAPDL